MQMTPTLPPGSPEYQAVPTVGSEMELIIKILMLIAIWAFPLWCMGSMVWRAKRKVGKLSYLHPVVLLATCFHIGLIKKAPGTWGILFAIYVLVWAVFLPRATTMSPDTLLIGVLASPIIVSLLGIWVCKLYGERTGREDPKEVVIDEVAGMWIAVVIAVLGYIPLYQADYTTIRPLLYIWWQYLILLFLLFRLFDIWKPWVIGWADRKVKGGLGVMLDDILAGFAAGMVFLAFFYTMHYSDGFLAYFKVFYPDFVGPLPTHPLPEG